MHCRLELLIENLINRNKLAIIKLPPSKKYWAIFLKNLYHHSVSNIIIDITGKNLNFFLKKVNKLNKFYKFIEKL